MQCKWLLYILLLFVTSCSKKKVNLEDTLLIHPLENEAKVALFMLTSLGDDNYGVKIGVDSTFSDTTYLLTGNLQLNYIDSLENDLELFFHWQEDNSIIYPIAGSPYYHTVVFSNDSLTHVIVDDGMAIEISKDRLFSDSLQIQVDEYIDRNRYRINTWFIDEYNKQKLLKSH